VNNKLDNPGRKMSCLI